MVGASGKMGLSQSLFNGQEVFCENSVLSLWLTMVICMTSSGVSHLLLKSHKMLGLKRADLRHVGILLSHYYAWCVQWPADFIGQKAFDYSDGMIQPPQIPGLHEAVLSCRHQQVPERGKKTISQLYSSCVRSVRHYTFLC